MNKLDKDYQALLQDILDNGVTKSDRTGTGTISVFGRQIRHKMSDGFPLLTTKKMAWKTMVTELLWFLKGDTNIKYLVDNNCHIWDGDAYNNWVLKNSEPDQYWLTKEEFIDRIKTDDEFAKKWGELGPIYGKQWRNWEGRIQIEPCKLDSTWEYLRDDSYVDSQTGIRQEPIDQIANLINDLKTNPDSRRLMVSAWNVGELDQMVLPPCHYGFQVYTRELSLEERNKSMGKDYAYRGVFSGLIAKQEELDKYKKLFDEQNRPTRAISLMWNQRSVDTFLGLPFNISSYGLLLEIIAKAVNMVPDELIGNLGDVHLYSNHIDQAKEQINRTSFELPTLNINTEFWPYEGGSCGEGPLNAIAIFNAFKDDNFCKCLLEEDIQLSNYQSHPTIKATLSN